MGLFRMLKQWREESDGTLTGPKLSTEEIDSTVWALEQSGANGGEKLQNAIDTAANKAGSTAVIVTGSPDDLTSYANNDQSDGWLVDTTLQHKSGVHVECLGNPYFYLAPETGYMLENGDITNGDDDLSLVGGTWDCNGSASGNDTAPGDKKGNFVYGNVSNLAFDPDEIRDHGTNLWSSQIFDWEDVYVGRHKIDGDKDGPHLHGPGKGAIVDMPYGDSGDDILAFTTAEYDTHNPSEGDIEDVLVRGADERYDNYENGGVAFAGNSNYVIKDVHIDTIFGGKSRYPLHLRNDSNIVGDGLVRVEDLTVGTIKSSGDAGNEVAFFADGDHHKNISIGTIQIHGAATIQDVVNLTGGTFDSVSIGSVQVGSGASIQNIFKLSGATVRSATVPVQCTDVSVGGGFALNSGEINSLTVSGDMYDSACNFINLNGATVDDVKLSGFDYVGPGGADGTGQSGSIIESGGNAATADITVSDATISHATQLVDNNGDDLTVKVSNSTMRNLERIAALTNTSTLNLKLSNVEGESFVNTEFFVGADATIDVEEQMYDSNGAGGSMFQLNGGTVRVDGPNIRVAIGNVTADKYDRAYNTDSGQTAGVGEVLYQGSAWKNFDAI